MLPSVDLAQTPPGTRAASKGIFLESERRNLPSPSPPAPSLSQIWEREGVPEGRGWVRADDSVMGEGLGLLPNRALSASVRRPSANGEYDKLRASRPGSHARQPGGVGAAYAGKITWLAIKGVVWYNMGRMVKKCQIVSNYVLDQRLTSCI